MLTIDCRRPWLTVRFATPHRLVSWAPHRPGFVTAREVAWREVGVGELGPEVDADRWFADELAQAGLADAVGMLTARNVASYVCGTAKVEGVRAGAIVTLGLRNGERIGARRVLAPEGAGTINILATIDRPLTDAALLEASALVVQARTVALIEAGYRAARMDAAVTGTGTDCVVMAAPATPEGEPYAGMHTAVGEAVGACVLAAVRQAAADWIGAPPSRD
ncbi:adenosylcobinamide amidohydrolase [Ancylobacter radicis]|uniref:Adenosylcobinamide amidohydrolase n=1 Tax=Ancylobacter radicis TaxID=2836179 RepID=A0ABS5R9P8_9HYPH|nr:adenosylcobinamide amidohydrolase [Ancylobacter radicis]MBS9478404.1 adenosylcobinamide amidohydrolase [Ancylobacter radicis]